MQTELESACIGLSHLAERLDLSRRTIHRLISRGELPTIKIGRRRLVRLSEVHRWLAGHDEAGTPGKTTNIARQFASR